MERTASDPIRDYRRLALGILLISFVPDILLAITHGFGGGWPEALSLMSMHIAVWAICVTVLPAAVVVRADVRDGAPASDPRAETHRTSSSRTITQSAR